MTIEQLEREVLQLPTHLRARLAECLLASLDEGESEGDASEIEEAWRQEAERRAEELASGAVKGIPAEEVFRNVRARLR